jgi:hypothetical protein
MRPQVTLPVESYSFVSSVVVAQSMNQVELQTVKNQKLKMIPQSDNSAQNTMVLEP